MADLRAVRLGAKARADLADIWTFTARRWSVAQADRYVTSLDRSFGLLAEFPDLGRLRQEIVPPVRVHRHQSHLIVYRDLPEALEIVRVLHMRRDLAALLDD